MPATRYFIALLYDQRGLALGPILLIVVLLGLLAAALAAGSGSFTGNSQSEAARSKGAALIQIGTILKVGFSRMTGAGVDFDNVNIDPDDTSSEVDLFSPSGGSVNVPSVVLANNPASDIWHYPLGSLPQIGTGATDRVAMLKVPLSICDEVNRKTNGIGISATDSSLTADIGDVAAVSLTGASVWPALLAGKEAGCLNNSNAATPGFFYFQVLGIR